MTYYGLVRRKTERLDIVLSLMPENDCISTMDLYNLFMERANEITEREHANGLTITDRQFIAHVREWAEANKLDYWSWSFGRNGVVGYVAKLSYGGPHGQQFQQYLRRRKQSDS